jgi:hypothetical protein
VNQPTHASGPKLGDLIGQPLAAVRVRFGEPSVDRSVAGDRWLIYERSDTRLRIRLVGDGGGGARAREERVASWTLTYSTPELLPEEAARSLGLDLTGDLQLVGDSELKRCAFADPVSGGVHSLTATTVGGRLRELTAFDEPPEWLDAPLAEER